MQLSIIFGTYNRLSILQHAVETMRASVGSITYELVVCDGGSTDGSREWLLAQPDVVLIAKRSLDGAVDAFNLCARAARGDYIVALNDDCEVHADALQVGYRMMESDPLAGLGAFEMNTGGGEGPPWGLEKAHGPYYLVNYGIARRAFVEQVTFITGGYWAPCYHTYAGDTELSLWAIKLGWKVLPIAGRVKNLPAPDALRSRNTAQAPADVTLFYQRWPMGWPPEAILPQGPWPNITPEERMRFGMLPQAQGVFAPTFVVSEPAPPVLPRRKLADLDPTDTFPLQTPCAGFESTVHLHLTNKDNPQPELAAALRRISRAGYVCYPWQQDAGRGREYVRDRLLEHVRKQRPSLVWAQLQSAFLIPSDLDAVRECLPRDGLLVTWNGDLAPPNSLSPEDLAWQKELYKHVDLSLHFTLDHVAQLRQAGVPAAYLQIGYDTAWFYPAAPALRTEFDSVFFANAYESLRPEWAGPRVALAQAMQRAFGRRFGLYGVWRIQTEPRIVGLGAVTPQESGGIYRRSLCAVSASVTDDVHAMSSDRLPRALASGCCVMVKRFKGSNIWGLQDNVNCVFWDTPEELVEKTKYMVDHRDEALAIGVAGAKLAAAHHTWDVRMREMQPLLDSVRSRRRR